MVDLNKLRTEAERAIRAAFPVGEAPSPAAMRNDHCPECQETAARFTGKLWSMEFPMELDCFPDGVIGVLSPKGASLSGKDADRLRFTQAQAQSVVAFLRFFELRKKLDWSEPDWPDEAILAMPTERSLERAIEFWSVRASEGEQ